MNPWRHQKLNWQRRRPERMARAWLPNATLAELFARMAATPGHSVEVAGDELAGWPADDVAAIRGARLLVPAKPGASAVCAGCERACVMPVQVLPRSGGAARLFIVCDKRDDIGRVDVAPAALERWRVTATELADALARLLGSDSATPVGGGPAALRVGVIQGLNGKRAAVLAWNADGPMLMVAGHELELGLIVDIAGAALRLDLGQLARCADLPAGADSGADETPEERRQRYVMLLEQERSISMKGCLKRAVARSGVKESAFKQVVYRRAKAKTAMEHMASGATGPGLAKQQNKR